MAVIDVDPFQSFGEASPEDLEWLESQLAPEREWYENIPAYETYADIEQAIEDGDLFYLRDNHAIRLLPRFSQHPDMYVGAASAATRSAIYAFGNEWALTAREWKLPIDSLRLAVTSLVRPVEYSNLLVDKGTLASPDSTHTKGGAVDIDLRGYYRLEGDIWVCVGHPDRQERQQALLEEIRQTNPAKAESMHYAYDFDDRVMEITLRVAQARRERGILNYIQEFEGTPNSVLHIAAHPEFE